MIKVGGGPVDPSMMEQLLFVGRSLNMAVTSDQALTKMVGGTNYMITKVVGVRKTGAFGTACLGGIYTATSKGGSALVAAAQTWANLTGAGKAVDATLAAVVGTDAQSATTLYLSLTTANTGALTADVFVFGVVID